MRLMALKQKILFVSQSDACGYSPNLVQQRFLHTMLTGLKSDNVRSEMRPLLKNPTTTDDDLLDTLSKAVADETEHQDKFKAIKKTANVSCIETPEKRTEEKEKEKKHTVLGDLCQEVRELKAHVMELSVRVPKPPKISGNSGNQNKYRNRRNRCEKCIENGVESCNHCFVCFSTEHFSRGCKHRSHSNKISKNGK